RIVSELRPLEDPSADPAWRAYAPNRQPALCVVGFPEHPLLHHQGLPRALSRGGRADGEVGGARCVGAGVALQRALVDAEFRRRTGPILAQPAGRVRRGARPREPLDRCATTRDLRRIRAAQFVSSSPTAISPGSTTSA